MSFQDVEQGLSQPAPLNSPGPSAFKTLQSSLGLQVFKLNSNIQGILKLVDQLGTSRDNASLRKTLHDLTESTRDMSKRAGEELKQLAMQVDGDSSRKTLFEKTSHDVQRSLVAFQNAQKVSAERQRTVVQGVKLAVDQSSDQPYSDEPPASPQQRQAQLLQSQLSPHELAYQQTLVQEREAEIREIETGIHELADIFRDLGSLVNQQGDMLENIESNISSVEIDTGAAARELTQAHEYQRKAGRRAACLMIIVIIVVAIVLLA
ncbi:t-SNARE, partial [Flagelloscypha sp. PMI_526]